MNDKIDWSALREKLDAETLIEWLGLHGTLDPEHKDRTGKIYPQWRGKCPACAKSDRSLVITPHLKAFCCHDMPKKDGKPFGGDLIGLAAHVLKKGNVDAARELQNHLLKQKQPPIEERPSQETPAHADSPSVSPTRDLAIMVESMTAEELRKLADTLDKKGYDRVTFIT